MPLYSVAPYLIWNLVGGNILIYYYCLLIFWCVSHEKLLYEFQRQGEQGKQTNELLLWYFMVNLGAWQFQYLFTFMIWKNENIQNWTNCPECFSTVKFTSRRNKVKWVYNNVKMKMMTQFFFFWCTVPLNIHERSQKWCNCFMDPPFTC